MELVVAPIAELRPKLTHFFEDVVGATLERGGGESREPYMFSCGLTGGSTALIFLGALREAAVDWAQITLYWGDERAVPPDHPDSNYGLAERLLLAPLGGRAPRAVRMPGELPDLEQAAREYAQNLPPLLDLLILGVGDDGHVCSLFPGHPVLRINDVPVAPVFDAPKPPPRRLTLTLPYIQSSSEVWIVAVGPRKLAMLQRAVLRESASAPIDLVIAQSNVTVFTDQVIRSRAVRR